MSILHSLWQEISSRERLEAGTLELHASASWCQIISRGILDQLLIASLCLASSAKEAKTVITHKSKVLERNGNSFTQFHPAFLLVTLFAAVVSSKELVGAGTWIHIPKSIAREKTSITVITRLHNSLLSCLGSPSAHCTNRSFCLMDCVINVVWLRDVSSYCRTIDIYWTCAFAMVL